MRLLPNNCRVGNITISPANYKTGGKTLLKKDWYISYRFYDDNLGKKKQVTIRGFADFEDLEERRAAIEHRLKTITADLVELGYNPITGTVQKPIVAEPAKTEEIHKDAPFIEAMRYAKKKKEGEVATRTMSNEIGPYLKYIEIAAVKLKYDQISIWDVSLKNLFLICEEVSKLKDGGISADKFNRCKKVLGEFYDKLLMLEAVPANIPLSIKTKKRMVRNRRDLIMRKDIDKTKTFLAGKDPAFWRFMNIYFHSGARLPEILNVKVKDVNIDRQTVTYFIKKGTQYGHKTRPIKDIAVSDWKEAIAGSDPEHYVFSRFQKPGPQPVSENAMTVKWGRLRKMDGLKVKFSLYDLKRLNSTETAEMLGVRAAAIQNAESEEMIRRHYDLEHEVRENEQIRKVNNPL